jgi:hypothetical protein
MAPGGSETKTTVDPFEPDPIAPGEADKRPGTGLDTTNGEDAG